MAPRPYYITTPIYYVNDKPHIGHCYTTTVADCAARFERLLGRDVFFLTGTDEHGQKVEKSAASRGVSPQALADENAAFFERAMAAIGASNDDFIRTTQARHTRQVQAALTKLIASGDVYLGTFEGWYDEGQEEYVTENQAREKDFKAFNGQPLKRASEQNYYFRLSKWQPALEKLLRENPEFVQPEARRNEVLGRLREGLQDVPVSRTNFSWGIPVPDAPGHVTYVWIDALLNYATAVGAVDAGAAGAAGVPVDRARFWPASVHLIGKEILWFHAVIWPALLMALGLELPGRVYAHSFWIAEGKKMSKTLGNFIDLPTLEAYAARYSLDAVRWYLLTQGPLRETDADFGYAKFVEVYNADLANSVSNSINRVGNMIEKYFGGSVPDAGGKHAWTGAELLKLKPADIPAGPLHEGGVDWPARCRAAVETATAALERFDLESALRAGRGLVTEVDAFISVTAPFKLAKLVETDAGAKATLASILYGCAETLRVATLLLHPAMPSKTAAAWGYWNCSPLRDAADPKKGFVAPLSALGAFGGPHSLRPGAAIVKGEPLFMRAKAEDPAPVPA